MPGERRSSRLVFSWSGPCWLLADPAACSAESRRNRATCFNRSSGAVVRHPECAGGHNRARRGRSRRDPGARVARLALTVRSTPPASPGTAESSPGCSSAAGRRSAGEARYVLRHGARDLGQLKLPHDEPGHGRTEAVRHVRVLSFRCRREHDGAPGEPG